MDIKFTCITCRVAFHDSEIQRQHYKTDWHRYNLKRKVADFPPVTAEDFQKRVLLQRAADASKTVGESFHCITCNKYFSSQNTFDNHLNSKKHKLGVHKHPYEEDEKSITDDLEVEEVDSDEWEELSDDNPIEHNDCLFCSNHSKNMFKNIKHMTAAHSFFIPHVEYVTDMNGLVMYLGEKVSKGRMCLWCNERGKTFHSKEAAQQHMQDKGHCKMLHEGEALAEYADFYDYSSSYPLGGEVSDADMPMMLDDSDYQLVLPSGLKIGHRSLMRYYRQSVPSNRSVTTQQKIHRVLSHYRSLGWKETQEEQAARNARDLHFMRNVQSKYYTKLGVKANKLQKHFRPQVNF